MNTIVVAISKDVTSKEAIYSKLDESLSAMNEYELVAVNDTQQFLKNYGEERGTRFSFKNCPSRIAAKQIAAKATHLIVFWSGLDLTDLIFFAVQRKVPTKLIPFLVTTVANKDTGQAFDVYIGRGTPLGNPFAIEHGTDADRAHVIGRYREYFFKDLIIKPDMKNYIEGLRGLRLGCHCKPLPCHGDVIAEYLNSAGTSEK